MMNRQQRRHLAKIQGKANGPLGHAANQLQQAVGALQSIKGLEAMTQQIAEAHRLVTETHVTVSALVEDYQTMADEVEVLRGMVLSLMGDRAEELFRERLAHVQARRSDEVAGTTSSS